jgi:hypothetical protein
LSGSQRPEAFENGEKGEETKGEEREKGVLEERVSVADSRSEGVKRIEELTGRERGERGGEKGTHLIDSKDLSGRERG